MSKYRTGVNHFSPTCGSWCCDKFDFKSGIARAISRRIYASVLVQRLSPNIMQHVYLYLLGLSDSHSGCCTA